MKKLAALVALAGLVLAPGAVLSEDWTGLSKALEEKCAKSMAQIKDVAMTMEITNESPRGSMVSVSTLYRKGDDFRAETTLKSVPGGALPPGMADMKTIVVKKDGDLWMINPMTGKSRVPLDQASQYSGQWLCADYLPREAEVAGSDTVGGRDCWVIVDKDEGSPYARLWIDKRSDDLVKFEGRPQRAVPATVAVFSDFRKVADGWEIPFESEITVGKGLTSTITVTSVSVNNGLSDDLFDVDKIAAGPGDATEMMKKMKKAPREAQ